MYELPRRQFLGSSLTASVAGLGLTSAAFSAEESEGVSRIGKTPHTRFAVNVEMWWTKLPFLDRVRMAAKYGFPAIEFWPWRNKDLPALVKLCDELQIAIAQFTAWGFSPGMNDPKNHDAFLRELEASCKVAQQIKCPMMTVVGGNDQPGMSQPQMHDNIIAALKRAAPIAAEHKVTLILEPMNIRVDHKGHCLYGSAPTLKICNAVNSPFVKINWDLYHMHITEGDLCGHMKEGIQAGHIGYLQLADHPGRHEPGTGEIHYNRVLKEAWNLGYRGFVGLECKPTNEHAAAQAVARADIW